MACLFGASRMAKKPAKTQSKRVKKRTQLRAASARRGAVSAERPESERPESDLTPAGVLASLPATSAPFATIQVIARSRTFGGSPSSRSRAA